MKTYSDCVSCFFKHVEDSTRFLRASEEVRERVLRDVRRETERWDMASPPPIMGQRIQRIIREVTGSRDPYREPKRAQNRLMLRLLPRLRERVAAAAEPFEAAVRFAIAGNVIDLGTADELTEEGILRVVESAAETALHGDVRALERAAAGARRILYLADNAGEIVLDRLVLERLRRGRVAVAVRGGPVLNDALLEDAREAGLTEDFEVLDNGSDAPGTVLDDCSEDFRRRFEEADLVIAKGQGNYETLDDAQQHVFFLLMAKCAVVTRRLGCGKGELIVREKRPERAPAGEAA